MHRRVHTREDIRRCYDLVLRVCEPELAGADLNDEAEGDQMG